MTEWRVSPSAGGLHPIEIVCIPDDPADGIQLYDSTRHCFLTLKVDADAVVRTQKQALRELVSTSIGTSLLMVGDCAKLEAAYEYWPSLLLRDAGALLTTICLVAEYLGLVACPLGYLGQPLVKLIGFPEPRFRSVGGVVVGATNDGL
jgi:hypothetical protein